MQARYTLSAALVALAMVCQAQVKTKIDIPLRNFLAMEHPADEQLDIYVHGPATEVALAVLEHGGTVKMALPTIVSARVPVNRIESLAMHPAVKSFECSFDKGHLLNDSMRVKNRVDLIHAATAPLHASFDGEGVVMGIIDAGLDWNHPDFKDENGNTRILSYWDQTLPVNGQTPQPYNYGQVWSQTQINAGQMTSVDQAQWYGHGTSVAGTAAGNGLANGLHKGVAPKADIIVVSAAFSGNFRARVADAVKYILDEAAALGRPVVINASLGTYLGSHDGLDASALFINNLLDQAPGRVMVCGGGNSNTFPRYHVRTNVTADTAFSWYRYNQNFNPNYGAVYFEVWADTANFNNVQYAVGADKPPPYRYRGRTPFHNISENIGTLIRDSLYSVDGNLLGVVEFYGQQRGGQYSLQVFMQQPDSTDYRFRFMSTGQGMHDVWSGTDIGTSLIQFSTPGPNVLPDIVHYVLPDRNMHIVDSWACSPKVITLANYVNEVAYINYFGNVATVAGTEGDIAAESSHGPSRIGLVKPDMAATGSVTISAYPLDMLATLIAANDQRVATGGLHMRNGGTSMASPVVAGAAALYLQKCPQATYQEVMDAIFSTVVADDLTGEVPNAIWGRGKLDAFAALLTSSTPILLDAPTSFCAGEQVAVSAPDELFDLTWSDGSTGQTILVDDEGPIHLTATNSSGCQLFSDTLSFTIDALPVPTVQVSGNVVISSEAASYQWLENGNPLPGATEQELETPYDGNYQVLVTDANGCSGLSEVVQVITTGIATSASVGFTAWPSPVRDVLQVGLPTSLVPGAMLDVYDASGALLIQQAVGARSTTMLNVEALAPGTYLLQLRNGAERHMQRFVKVD